MTTASNYSTYLKKVEQAFQVQADKPEETPKAILHALWSLAQGVQLSVFAANNIELNELTSEEAQLLDKNLEIWAAGEPIAYLTERQHFCGLELKVSRDALIPRSETELLANAVLQKLSGLDNSKPLVLDVCTGCGNLALAYKHKKPDASVYAADLSDEAISLAKENADFVGLSQDVSFFSGDLFEPFNNDDFLKKVDIISCNPPYISSKKVPEMPKAISDFEPSMAFDGGPFGISILQRVMSEAPNYLRENGWLVFEVGAGQGPSIAKMLNRNDAYQALEMIEDKEGVVRVIAVQKVG
ncbi:hypothetical protein NBRC116493_14810 [Aurantivibrio infirmus]